MGRDCREAKGPRYPSKLILNGDNKAEQEIGRRCAGVEQRPWTNEQLLQRRVSPLGQQQYSN